MFCFFIPVSDPYLIRYWNCSPQKDINSTLLLPCFSMSPPKHAQLKPTIKISTNCWFWIKFWQYRLSHTALKKTITLKILFWYAKYSNWKGKLTIFFYSSVFFFYITEKKPNPTFLLNIYHVIQHSHFLQHLPLIHFIFFPMWTVTFLKEILILVFAKYSKTSNMSLKYVIWGTRRKSLFCSSSCLKPHVNICWSSFDRSCLRPNQKEKWNLGLSFLNTHSEQQSPESDNNEQEAKL